jgi:CheY-like chemotaxis protein
VANNGVEGLKAFDFLAVLLFSDPHGYSDADHGWLRSHERPSFLKRADAKGFPIVAMTADAFEDDVKKCLAIGMNAHIAKPIDPTLLYATLEKGLEKK